MLKKHLVSLPPTKFVLIQDCLRHRGKGLVEYLLRHHLNRNVCVHYFAFEGRFTDIDQTKDNVVFHDYTSDPVGWLDRNKKKSFEHDLVNISNTSVVVIDSLSHAFYYYGLSKLCCIIHKTLNLNVQQLIAIVHTDLLVDLKALQQLVHLSTLNLILESTVDIKSNRMVSRLKQQTITYVHKKLGGKIEKGIEQYELVDGDLTCKPCEVLDLSVMAKDNGEIIPENLTTFKIGLDEKAKESKDKLVLPYLPKDTDVVSKITYEFDNLDDWDEEDPDDDLDI